MSERTVDAVRWGRFLPRAAILAVAEGLLGGTLFSSEGGGFIPGIWLLMATITAVGVLANGVLAYRIGRRFLSRWANAEVALVIGAMAGFAVAYLLQPRGGPV